MVRPVLILDAICKWQHWEPNNEFPMGRKPGINVDAWIFNAGQNDNKIKPQKTKGISKVSCCIWDFNYGVLHKVTLKVPSPYTI